MDEKIDKKIHDLINNFNRQISKLVNMADNSLSNNPNIDWLKRIVRIVKNENPNMLIDVSSDKIWENKTYIMNHDIEFFKTCSFEKYTKGSDHAKMIDELIKLFRDDYDNLTTKEHAIIWECMDKMLKNIIEYRLIKGDHS
jgi:translation initiation factor 2B subunit (eIF-2B alpha/beta/delta family)